MARLTDKNVVRFPAMQAIPAPSYNLAGVAYDVYLEHAKALLSAGKLNAHTKVLCEHLGIVRAQNHKRVSDGLAISARALDRETQLLKELRLVDDSNEAAPAPKGENRYSRIGIIVRPGAEKATVRGA